jgi:hypothetical protein
MKHFSLEAIIKKVDAPTRRTLIKKEIWLLGIIFAGWLFIILSDVITYNVTGHSWLQWLLTESGSSRRRGSLFEALALFLMFGPPIFIVFRLVLARFVLANRVTGLLLEEQKLGFNEYAALRKQVYKRMSIVILLVLSCALVLIIIYGVATANN